MIAAPRLRVFIATTSGPVEIQRITEEDPEVDSVVCLAGKAMPLPISAGYQNFVRQPTGVVQRLFGHASYRVDLAATVEDGYSWQLGILLGHAAVQGNRFAGGDAAAEIVVFATGEVNVDLEVLPVGHVAAKLRQLAATASDLAAAGAGIVVVVPDGNAAEASADPLVAAGVPEEACRVVTASRVTDALAALALESEIAGGYGPPPMVVDTGAPRRQRRRARLVAAHLGAIVLLLGGAWGAWSAAFADWRELERSGRLAALDAALTGAAEAGGLPAFRAGLFERWLEFARPTGVDLRLVEYRAPDGRNCAAVRFGASEAVPRDAEMRSPRAFAPSRFEGLCALEMVAEGGSGSVYLWGRYERSVSGPASGGPPDDSVVLGPGQRVLHWKIDLPQRLREELDFRVVVLAARHPIDGSAGWVSGILPSAGETVPPAAWFRKVERLKRRGLSLLDARFSIVR